MSVSEFERELWAALLHHLRACKEPWEDLQIDVSMGSPRAVQQHYDQARERVLKRLESLAGS